jgi:hypothetical protein
MVLLFVLGYASRFWLSHFHLVSDDPKNFNTNIENQDHKSLTDEAIVNIFNVEPKGSEIPNYKFKEYKKGTYSTAEQGGTGEGYNWISDFIRGDINSDGYEDAVIEDGSCGASCSSNRIVILNNKDGTAREIRNGFDVIVPSSAAQSSIEKVSIDNGVISLTGYGFADVKDWHTLETAEYKLEEERLVRIQ